MSQFASIAGLDPFDSDRSLLSESALYDGAVGRHVHTAFELMLVKQGYGTLISKHDAVFLTPGSVLIIKPGNAHQLADCFQMQVQLCRFASNLLLAQNRSILSLERVRALVTHHVSPAAIQLGSAAVSQFSLMMQEIQQERETRSPGWQEALKAAFVRLLLAYARAEDVTTGRLPETPHHCVRYTAQVVRYLHQHYDQPITLDSLAAHVSLSRDYLTRCFQQVTLLTPIAYLRRLRMAEGLKLLRQTKEPVALIARQVGIQDAGSFTRQFKSVYGVAPLQARKADG